MRNKSCSFDPGHKVLVKYANRHVDFESIANMHRGLFMSVANRKFWSEGPHSSFICRKVTENDDREKVHDTSDTTHPTAPHSAPLDGWQKSVVLAEFFVQDSDIEVVEHKSWNSVPLAHIAVFMIGALFALLSLLFF